MPARRHGSAGVSIAHLGVVGHVRRHRSDASAVAVRHVLAGLGVSSVCALASPRPAPPSPSSPVSSLLLVLLALLVLLLVGIARAVLAHVERVEQVVDGVAEARLVLDQLLQPVEFAPARSSISGATDRPASWPPAAAPAGQPLAHHHRHRILDRRIGAVGDLVEFAAMVAVVEHGGEILRDAGHAARADRLDARLLDRLEHRARLLAAGHELAVHAPDRGRRA